MYRPLINFSSLENVFHRLNFPEIFQEINKELYDLTRGMLNLLGKNPLTQTQEKLILIDSPLDISLKTNNTFTLYDYSDISSTLSSKLIFLI